MKNYLICCLVGSMALLACQNVGKQKLVGKWQAVSILEDGMPMPIPVSVVGFEFYNNGYYNFRSTLEYKEAGTYDVSSNFLYTLDTVNEASTQKIVEIMQVAEDSLLLKMNADGKEQLIKLFKSK